LNRIGIFISSVQKEFANERKAIRDFVNNDPLLNRFFTIFLFEDAPVASRSTKDVYLDEVRNCTIYVGLIGAEYGFEDNEGISPTEREFEEASKLKKVRFVFVKDVPGHARHTKEKSLLNRIDAQLVRRKFSQTTELISGIYSGLILYLLETKHIRTGPFDASACKDSTIDDISTEKVSWFLQRARSMRQFALSNEAPVTNVLSHLNLFDGEQPNNAAILLFGKLPQHFLISSEIKCMHFHGTEIGKPIPSYQIFKGTIFDLVDQAVDFVLSKLNRKIGTRANGPVVSEEYDIPPEVVSEAIINAVAHRDYSSEASVQVMLFADRLEVLNPGILPNTLTLEKLSKPHASVPRNPLIADPLFLTKYIEKAGTGTLDMITRCRNAGMKLPEYSMDGDFFFTKIWRNTGGITGGITGGMTGGIAEVENELTESQIKVLRLIRTNPKITLKAISDELNINISAVQKHIDKLRKKGVVERIGPSFGGFWNVKL
jgi:ATP-dependent DNA helicase RecG